MSIFSPFGGNRGPYNERSESKTWLWSTLPSSVGGTCQIECPYTRKPNLGMTGTIHLCVSYQFLTDRQVHLLVELPAYSNIYACMYACICVVGLGSLVHCSIGPCAIVCMHVVGPLMHVLPPGGGGQLDAWGDELLAWRLKGKVWEVRGRRWEVRGVGGGRWRVMKQ